MAEAATLKRGLEKLGPGFRAEVCYFCSGEGAYEQTYTIGCGAGYYRSLGRCDHCEGEGLVIGNRAAPRSVIAQVMTAAGFDKPNAPSL